MAKINEYAVRRDFAKRNEGEIGGVTLTAKIESFTVAGKELPPRSVEYLLNFALQSLQDAYAGAKSIDEAKGAFEKKLDALLAGTIGVRTGGSGESAELRTRRSVVAELIRAAGKGETLKGLEGDDRTAHLDAVFDKQSEANQEKIMARVAEKLAEAAARAKAAAKLAEDFDI